MAGGHVNRALLQQYYQNPGDTYDDAMTEGAYEVLAQQIDDNWDEYAAHRVAPEIDHPDGSVTGRKIRNGTITADKFVPGALTNETQNALRITQLENNFGAHAAKSVTDPGGVHGFRVETGTWTPIIRSTSGSNDHTYGSQSGRYVRMGDLVFVWGNVSLSAKDSGMAGNVVIGGLPFRVANDGHYPAANIGFYRYVAKGNSNELTARFDQNSTVVSFWEGGDNLGPVALTASKITNNTEFAIGGVYKINV